MPPPKLSPAPVGSTTRSVVRGEGRHDGDSVAMHQNGTVLALLDDRERRPQFEDLPPCVDDVAGLDELGRFTIVEHHTVDLLEQGQQVVMGDVDPEIHRVAHRERSIGKLVEQIRLNRGMAVGEEHVPTCRGIPPGRWVACPQGRPAR